MIRIHNLTVPALPEKERRAVLEKKICRFAGGTLPPYTIARRSVDARRKDDIRYVYTVDIGGMEEKRESELLRRSRGVKAERITPERYRLPASGSERLPAPVIIVGAGPAGLFAAWMLAEAGYSPLLLEQGAPVEERDRDVRAFWEGGRLKPWSNVQFGEGGAGTFSDGKLSTGIRDSEGRIREVLRIFTACGADPSIGYDAKPHIGTDCLKSVVKNMRQQILRKGGRFLFHTRLTGIRTENGVLCAACTENTLTGETDVLAAGAMILAVGHSARETFLTLHSAGLEMVQKSFAVGVRIEHPQRLINRIQYGAEEPENLPPADYKLTARTGDGRSVYSFCMCPGGQVVNASSEEGRLCVNGMSAHARCGRNANAALVVQVGPEDFEEKDLFAGMSFQRAFEEAAWKLCRGKIPVQRLADFSGNGKEDAPSCRRNEEAGRLQPDICGEWEEADVSSVLPGFVRDALRQALPQFDRKMPGYACPEALIEGFEGRTSSPLRIPRDDGGESNIKGIWPAGEGAGYAGGITSAAVDGIKAAEQIIRRFSAPDAVR